MTTQYTVKKCNICNTEKSVDEFDAIRGIYRGYCKICRREKDRIKAEERRRLKGIEKVKGTEFKCQTCGTMFIRNSIHNINCKPCAKQKVIEAARAESLKKARERGNRVMGSIQSCAHCGVSFTLTKRKSKYCDECKKLVKKNALPFMKAWLKSYKKEYMKDPIVKRRVFDNANALKRHKVKTDPMYALIGRVRARLNEVFRINGYTKRSKSQEIIGCSYEFLRGYIESKFVDGMTWENRNLWHIDHIIPLSSAKCEMDIIKLSHYTNLQPLWAEDNQRKGNKF
jgi:hypothetical protein